MSEFTEVLDVIRVSYLYYLSWVSLSGLKPCQVGSAEFWDPWKSQNCFLLNIFLWNQTIILFFGVFSLSKKTKTWVNHIKYCLNFFHVKNSLFFDRKVQCWIPSKRTLCSTVHSQRNERNPEGVTVFASVLPSLPLCFSSHRSPSENQMAPVFSASLVLK